MVFMHGSVTHEGLLQVEDCLDAQGGIVLPPGTTLISLIERNIANVGNAVAYRYLDFTHSVDGHAVELTWSQLGRRVRAVGVCVQRVTSRGDRVAILARRASITSPGSSERSRRGRLRCHCSRLNSRATQNVLKQRCAMRGPPPS
jgi:hypothetical protein